MAEVVKETTVTETSDTPVVATAETRPPASHTASYLIYFLFGLLEILLLFRLVFKLAGANPASPFVDMIYTISQIFIIPFEGIFRRSFAEGVETTSILEPSTLVAMVVYALLAWGVVKLIAILSGHPHNPA